MKRHFALAVLIVALATVSLGLPTQHQASLSYAQSATAGITSNCVYRSTVSGGPYTQIFCSTAPVTSYVDATVVGGSTYYYVVTALIGSEESNFSNEVKVVIPQSPSAPSGLTAVAQ